MNTCLKSADPPNDFEESSIHRVNALLGHARHGDATSLGELLQQYRNYLLLLATTQLNVRMRARVSPSDVVQETMLKAHANFANFRGRSERELLAWLRQILANNLAGFVQQHVLTAKRDVRREVSIEVLGRTLDRSTQKFEAILHDDQLSPGSEVARREEAVLLANRLAQLPEHYREVLVLRNLREMRFNDIAPQLDRSVRATRMLWLRAIDKLRMIYRKEKENGV